VVPPCATERIGGTLIHCVVFPRDSKSQYLVISGHRIEILRDISEYLAVSVFFKRFSDFVLRALPAASSEILDISRNLGCRPVAVSPVRSQNLARFTQSPRYSDFFLKISLVKAKSRDIEISWPR
jgi:hypothetical protein